MRSIRTNAEAETAESVSRRRIQVPTSSCALNCMACRGNRWDDGQRAGPRAQQPQRGHASLAGQCRLVGRLLDLTAGRSIQHTGYG